MKIKYDNMADAMYIRYSDREISYTKDNFDNDWVVDYDSDWNIVWIEIFWVKQIFLENNVDIKSLNKEKELH